MCNVDGDLNKCPEGYLQSYFYHPTNIITARVAKVMLSQASVILSHGGGGGGRFDIKCIMG